MACETEHHCKRSIFLTSKYYKELLFDYATSLGGMILKSLSDWV